MYLKYMSAVALLLLPTSSFAQAGPEAEKSAAQIVCELTADCAAFDQEATLAKGDERGFSLRLKRAGGAAAPASVPQAGTATRYAGPATVRDSGAGKRHPVARAVAPRPVGRSSLAIGFDTGSAGFTASGLSQARRLADALKAPSVTQSKFIVGGHTDSVGARDYNLDLSRRRAEAVVAYLVENGVDRARLDPQGYGFDKPVAGAKPRAAVNRRVEIVKVD